ncbi:8362_t:CDS:2, partial [Entrophospora sp. SA101]
SSDGDFYCHYKNTGHYDYDGKPNLVYKNNDSIILIEEFQARLPPE